jgi:WD40 repeat protein
VEDLAGDEDGGAWAWSSDGRATAIALSGHSAAVRVVRFTPDGRSVLTAADDGTARIRDLLDGRAYAVLRGHKAPLSDAVFSPDGERVVTASLDSTIRIWSARDGSLLKTLSSQTPTRAVSFSPDGSLLLAASFLDGTARLFQGDGSRELAVLVHPGPANIQMRAARFSSDGSRIVTAIDRTMRVWAAPPT